MEIIFMFLAGFVVFIIALFTVIKIAANKVAAPTNDLKEEVENLKKRINELEKE